MFIYKSLVLLVLSHFGLTQRVAPGVPPQQYQAPAQHQQQQYQQVPIQQQQYQQQVPVQQQHYQQHDPVQQQQFQQHIPVQQHVPVQQQQVPIDHHASHHPHQVAPGQILSAANIAHEKEHIAEHLSVPIDTSKMSEQELQFHYFKMHDADNNNKLDGCELIKSLIHWHAEDGLDTNDPKDAQGSLTQTDAELEALVDPILNDVDKDRDGFIDYTEFKKSEQVNTQT